MSLVAQGQRMRQIVLLTAMLFCADPVAAQDISKLSEYFSVGLAVIHLRDKQVNTAEVRGGIVRVVDDTDNLITPWLQVHHIFKGFRSESFKPGIFFGVGIGPSGNSFNTFGSGLVLSFKRTPWSDRENTGALNVGVGYFTTQYKTLADDTPEGQPLPPGVESPAYRTRNTSGWMLNLSFSI
jgi:hypothetical protein